MYKSLLVRNNFGLAYLQSFGLFKKYHIAQVQNCSVPLVNWDTAIPLLHKIHRIHVINWCGKGAILSRGKADLCYLRFYVERSWYKYSNKIIKLNPPARAQNYLTAVSTKKKNSEGDENLFCSYESRGGHLHVTRCDINVRLL